MISPQTIAVIVRIIAVYNELGQISYWYFVLSKIEPKKHEIKVADLVALGVFSSKRVIVTPSVVL